MKSELLGKRGKGRPERSLKACSEEGPDKRVDVTEKDAEDRNEMEAEELLWRPLK